MTPPPTPRESLRVNIEVYTSITTQVVNPSECPSVDSQACGNPATDQCRNCGRKSTSQRDSGCVPRRDRPAPSPAPLTAAFAPDQAMTHPSAVSGNRHGCGSPRVGALHCRVRPGPPDNHTVGAGLCDGQHIRPGRNLPGRNLPASLMNAGLNPAGRLAEMAGTCQSGSGALTPAP